VVDVFGSEMSNSERLLNCLSDDVSCMIETINLSCWGMMVSRIFLRNAVLDGSVGRINPTRRFRVDPNRILMGTDCCQLCDSIISNPMQSYPILDK